MDKAREKAIRALRARARRLDLVLRSDRRGGFMLVDPYTTGIVSPYPMTLEEVALWLEKQ